MTPSITRITSYNVCYTKLLRVSDEEIEQIITEQSLEIKRRIQTLRKGKELPTISGRTVILTDDGIAMGSTMHVAVELCKKAKASYNFV